MKWSVVGIAICLQAALASCPANAQANYELFPGYGRSTIRETQMFAVVLNLRNGKKFNCVARLPTVGSLPVKLLCTAMDTAPLMKGPNVRSYINQFDGTGAIIAPVGVWQIDQQTGDVQFCQLTAREAEGCATFNIP